MHKGSCANCGAQLRRKPGFACLDICQSCGLVQLAAPPDDEELTALYTEKYYDSWGDARTHILLKKSLFTKIIGMAGPRGGGDALDIGCATGDCLALLDEKGWRAHGVEVNPYAVEQARRRVPGAAVHQGTLESVCLEPGGYNLVIMSDVLEHLRSPRQTMEKVYSLLREGGGLAVLTPDISSLSARLLRRHWPHLKREHLVYFDKRTLERMLREIGFRQVRVVSARKPMNIRYAVNQFEVYPTPIVTPILKALGLMFPQAIQEKIVALPMGEMLAICRK